jgi:hypothetical protein
MPDQGTVEACIADALDAYAALAELGEEIEDEWSYVTDLRTAWTERLEAVAARRGADPVAPAVALAIATASDETRRITDPHRAIDWLSTYPQVVLIALGEQA